MPRMVDYEATRASFRVEIPELFNFMGDIHTTATARLRPGAWLRTIRALTAPYKYPREITYVAELPTTISDKICRVELRAMS